MTAQQVLWDHATEQYGYFTVTQARDLNISPGAVRMLARRHQIQKAAHGVYRLAQLPVTEYDEYMLAVLWTGSNAACLSHDTALSLYEVCDINPTRVHLTVPQRCRVRRSGGEGYALHYVDLDDTDVGWLHQIRATKFYPTLRGCVDSGVPAYLITQALHTGTSRGLLLPDQNSELERRMEARDA